MEPVRAERWRARGVRGLGLQLQIRGRHHHILLTRVFAPSMGVHLGPDVIRALFEGAFGAGYGWECAALERRTRGVSMENETREQIALARFKLISPVLAEPARARNEYFREQAGQEHDFPHYGPRRYAVSTLKSWLKGYA